MKSPKERKVPEWALDLPWPAIREHSARFGLDPLIVAAIIQIESAGNTNAIRYEKKWAYYLRVSAFAHMVNSSTDTEKIGQATSWGLMQVMGTVAREHDFQGWFPELCNPEIGIYYGCAHLDQKIAKYRILEDAIAAYNSGSPVKTVDGKYTNQYYVDKVLDNFRLLKDVHHP